MHRLPLPLRLTLAFVSVTVACSPQTEEATVVVLLDDDLAGATVLQDSIEIPSTTAWTTNLAEGDILASGIGRGFIREVVAIKDLGSTTIIDTLQAQLNDALSSALIGQDFHISEADKAAGIEDVGFGLADLSTVLHEEDGVKLEIKEGHILFRPSVDLDLDLGFDGIEAMELAVTGEIDIRTVIKASVDGSFSEKMTVQVWENEWHFIQMVGAIPVVEVVTASLDAELDIKVPLRASLTVGASAKGTIRGGLRYEEGEFVPFGDDPIFRFDPIAPVLDGEAGVEITGTLRPRLEVSLYELAAVSVDLAGELKFTGDLIERECELSSKVSGNFGASIGAFDFKKKFNQELFSIGEQLGCSF